MIARIWHGTVAASQAAEYHEFLLRTGVPDYQATPGNRGVQVLRRIDGDTAHFQIITIWDDLDSIRVFAGDEVERARYYDEDDDFLLYKEPFVTHFDVLPLEATT
jgi:heme-degrading monooxygenase HmoA